MGHAVRRQAVGVVAGISPDRIVALTVAAILLIASVLSVSAGAFTKTARPIGGTDGGGSAPRLAAGGAAGLDREDLDGPAEGDTGATGAVGSGSGVDIDINEPDLGTVAQEDPGVVSGPYLEDGTLLKPVAVDTTVEDGSDLLRTYKVKSGDTLTGIARKFKVSMMTLWWANRLDSKDSLKQGQVLSIPPVSGLVVTVSSNDTLSGLASKHKVKTQEILDANGLDDPNLVVGQVLVIPGAKGAPIPTPKPTRKPTVTKPRNTGGGGGSSGGGPTQYSGGQFAWPVSGGNNYISQFYHYGHYAIDIAGDYGSRVRAAAGGRVVFAGWKSNGGGYQVWISHGSGLYSTYNHMSAVSVGSGQYVDRGQGVGRIGQSGNATGPHLHFEVWKGGEPWNGGSRVNPLAYL